MPIPQALMHVKRVSRQVTKGEQEKPIEKRKRVEGAAFSPRNNGSNRKEILSTARKAQASVNSARQRM